MDSTSVTRAGQCGRLTPLISLRQSTAHATKVVVYWRSVRLPVACGGDDYAFVPSAAPSSRTDRRPSINLHPE